MKQASLKQSKTVRLVSTFGLGQNDREAPSHQVAMKVYESARYQWEDQISPETTTHVQLALAELFKVTSLGGVTTPLVESQWIKYEPKHERYEAHRGDRLGRELGFWSNLSKDEDIPAERRWPLLHLKVIQEKQERALYETFEAYRWLLSHEALEELGEERAPDEIIFDVTHGFRTQPIVGLAAALFTLQEWERLELTKTDTPKLKVVYGAFDARDREENIVPIWDITPFLSIQQLNNALSAMIRYGRSEQLSELVDELTEPEPWLQELREVTAKVSADLNLIRSHDLALHSAPELKQVTERALESIRDQSEWKMLTETLKALKTWASELTLEGFEQVERSPQALVSSEGHELMKRLAKRYDHLKNYPALLAVIAEDKISHQAIKLGTLDLRPSQPDRELGKLRNSVMHAQFDKGQMKHADLLESLKPHLDEFYELPAAEPKDPVGQTNSAGELLLVVEETEREELTQLKPELIHCKKLRRLLTDALDGRYKHVELYNRLRKYKHHKWVLSPQLAQNPNLSALLATAASKLEVELVWCERSGEGALSYREVSFKPSGWFD